MSHKLFNINAKRGLEFKNSTPTTAEIVIYSDIGQSFWGDSISAKDFHEMLSKIPETVNEITLRLNSPGGDVFDGIAIYNRLKQHKAKVTVYVDGYAASIASIIMLAGDEVIMSEGALVMIHKPWTGKWGNAADFEQVINLLDDIEEQMIGIYQRKTKLDRNEIRQMLLAETWFNADQALEKGFVTKKMAPDEKVDMAASLDRAVWMKKKPQVESASAIIKDDIKLLTKEIEEFLARSKNAAASLKP